MKILHIISDLYTGGGQKICIELCNELAKNSDNHIVLCSLEPMTDQQQIMRNKISSEVELIILNKKGNNPDIFLQVVKMIFQVKPDVINTNLRAFFFSSLGLMLSRIPHVHTLPTVADKEETAGRRRVYKFLYDFFNCSPVSMGKRVFDSCKKVYGKECKANIEIGTLPAEATDKYAEVKKEIDAFRKDENTKVFVSIGRFYPVKNQELLIESFELLLQEGYDAHLVILGAFDVVPEYAKLCQDKIKTPECVHLIGEKENVADYLIESDALCFSSTYEGLPMAMVEAMSVGVPTIATPVGGIPDLIQEGINGYMSEDMSVESYLALFKRFIENDKLDSEKIKNIFQEKYSIKQCANKYLDLYTEKVTEKSK
jgi:glycosyltransferase involved in cell wall biosynthesis